jgi:hypothetical protein
MEQPELLSIKGAARCVKRPGKSQAAFFDRLHPSEAEHLEYLSISTRCS